MRNLGRFQGWRRWGESSLQDAPESGPLRPNQSLAVLSDGEYREGSWSCQQRRQRLVVGEAVGESSRVRESHSPPPLLDRGPHILLTHREVR